MKKLVLLASLCLAVVMFTSCIGTNSMTYNTLNQTEVILSQNNFNVVGTAEGSYTVHYVFGLGGSSKSAIRENAVQQMYKNANLRLFEFGKTYEFSVSGSFDEGFVLKREK